MPAPKTRTRYGTSHANVRLGAAARADLAAVLSAIRRRGLSALPTDVSDRIADRRDIAMTIHSAGGTTALSLAYLRAKMEEEKP